MARYGPLPPGCFPPFITPRKIFFFWGVTGDLIYPYHASGLLESALYIALTLFLRYQQAVIPLDPCRTTVSVACSSTYRIRTFQRYSFNERKGWFANRTENPGHSLTSYFCTRRSRLLPILHF